MERVDVVELEPSVIHVAELCWPVNENVLVKDNVRIVIGDAREVLLTTNETYDIVFSEPSNPYRAGIASLFTREFYMAASARLRDGGQFIQWLQAYEISRATLETILVTIREVFPFMQLWHTTAGDLVLVASSNPIPVQYETIQRRLDEEPYRRALARAWMAASVEEVMAHYIGDQRLVERAIDLTAVDVNTDDRNIVEFGFARSVGKRSFDHVDALRAAARQLAVDSVPDVAIDAARVDRFRTTFLLARGRSEQDAILMGAFAAYSQGAFAEAIRLWNSAEVQPASHPETLLLAHSSAQVGSDACFEYADSLSRYSRTEADLVRGICVVERNGAEGDTGEAARYFTQGFNALRDDPWVDPALVVRALGRLATLYPHLSVRDLAGVGDALGKRFSVSTAEEQRRAAALEVARWIDKHRCGERTREALRAFEPHVPWNEGHLRLRARCYEENRHPLSADAIRDLEDFLSDVEVPFGVGPTEETEGSGSFQGLVPNP
jgi:hypothetical protein